MWPITRGHSSLASVQALRDLGKQFEARADEQAAFWRYRTQRMVMVRAMLVNMYKPTKIDGVTQFFSGEAKTLTDLALSTIAGKEPIWRMPLDNKDQTQRYFSSKSERLVEGIYRQNNRQYRRRLHGSWLNDFIWYILTGSYAVFPHIVEHDDDDQVDVRWDLWDPIAVYQVPGDTHLQSVYRVYQTERTAALTMAREQGWSVEAIDAIGNDGPHGPAVDRQADIVRVVNAWYMDGKDVINAVSIGGIIVKEPVHEDAFHRIPIITGPAAGMPFRDFENPTRIYPQTPLWQDTWGEALIFNNMPIYAQMDQLLTYEMEITRRNAMPTLIDTNDTGTLLIDTTKDIGKMKAVARDAGKGEKLEYLVPPTSPQERNEMLTYMNERTQRGGLSNIAYGQLSVRLAGVALQSLLTATRNKLMPYINSAQDVLGEVAMESLAQLKQAGKPLRLDVRQRSRGPSEGYIIEDFDPATDIPANSYVEVTLPLALQDDTMERVQTARIAQPMGNLMDKTTIRDKILQLQDPDVVDERMDEDEAKDSPVVKSLKFVFALRGKSKELNAAGQPEEADIMQRAADALMNSLEGQIAGNGGGPNAQGTPAKAAEPSGGVQPAEAGPVNPDQINMALLRNPTPGDGTPVGPANTLQDRLSAMGLVGPRG